MREFINAVTGTQMWVADDRVKEYEAAGHKLVVPVANNPESEEKPAKPRKATSKKGK